MTSQQRGAWDELWSEFEQLRAAISRSKAVNVNAAGLRTRTRLVVEVYFRQVRPALLQLGIGEPGLEKVDRNMQGLLQLSNGRNVKTSYVKVLRDIATERTALMALRERLLGETAVRPLQVGLERGEGQVLATLREMLPNAALSYEQGIRDLQTGDRISWRGTAAEFREVIREVLDYLAPDDEVIKQPGFKLEKDQAGPTMKQKASFVLRSRGVPETARKAPQEAVSIVDELTASFVRSTYQRGSVSTHGSPTLEEVERLKRFVDVALADLLEAREASPGGSP